MRALYALFVLAFLFAKPTHTVSPTIKTAPVQYVRHHKVMTAILSGEQVAIRDRILITFRDVPRMISVIQCESDFRQFDNDGKPLVSSTGDVGIMQINRNTWSRVAVSLGYDIDNSIEDNIKMGRIIYERQGISAWVCARV